jgi:hypothetical protein
MSLLTFASPGLAIAAGVATAVPVAIHLLMRRRRKPVEWAAMDLLREALRRVERKRRVERWLLLAVRCLLVICAGLAIAAPFIGSTIATTRVVRTLVVIIDDSAAANERLGSGTAFDQSLIIARSEIEQLLPGDRVAVVLTSRANISSREAASLDHRGAIQRLTGLAATESAGDLSAALTAATAILAHEESTGTHQEILVCSAFRAGFVGGLTPLQKVGSGEVPVTVRATTEPTPDGVNLRVTSIEVDRVAGTGPGAPVVLRVMVARDRGDGVLRTTVRVTGPTLTSPVERPVELSAGERERAVTVMLSERAGDPALVLRRAVVASISADAQPVDDSRATILAPTDRLRVVVVDRRTFETSGAIDRLPAGEWVSRALAPGEAAAIDVTMTDPAALDSRTIAATDTIVIAQPQLLNTQQWALLTSFVGRGGVVVVLPAAGELVQAWTTQFTGAFSSPWKLALEARDLAVATALASEQPNTSYLATLGAELPQLSPAVEVFRTLAVDVSMDPTATQLSLQDGNPFVVSWRPLNARGMVVLFTSAIDLSWTTLPLKPLMVPLWQELIAEGRRHASAAQVVVVGSQPDIDRAGVVELRPIAPDGGALPGARSIAVGAGGRATSPIERGGMFEMLDSSGRVQGVMAAIVDDRAASVAPVEHDQLNKWLSTCGEVSWVGGGNSGGSRSGTQAISPRQTSSVAPSLFALAVLLAVLEAFLARRFSYATGAQPTMSRQPNTQQAVSGGAL